MSEKRQRFERVAGNRVQAIIEKIDSLAKCSNKNNYSYSEQDVKKMFFAIKTALKKTELKFEDEIKKQNKHRFKF